MCFIIILAKEGSHMKKWSDEIVLPADIELS